MSAQRIAISPNYTKYSDYTEDNVDDLLYIENQPLTDTQLVDTFSIKIIGCVDIDGVDETIITEIKDNPLEGNYRITHRYKYTHGVIIKLHLYRKYYGYDCRVTYEYKYGYISLNGQDFTINITDGSLHPSVQLCEKNARAYRISNITYIGKGSTLHNFGRKLRGVFLSNYVTPGEIKPY
ncbi:hypothetical protein PV-S19_0402 [Pacmanvirus S19]|nr:hypothetical protein PV-S19_0402 [Pacmanvirus S19]